MNIIRPGTCGHLSTSPPIDCLVLQALIGMDGVSYEVAWWDGRTRRKEWVTDVEVSVDDVDDVIRIGFCAATGQP